jgi:WD40 repeat protein/class 3 adenylate cyclase
MLQIRLLGQFDARVDGKRVAIPTRAAQSLLAYLVLTAGTPHRREKLAGIFWPDTSEENARKNLRQELWRIRKAISTGQSAGSEYFLADELTLTFNRDADYWLDVSQMERPDLDLQSLTANLSLYQGELLPGFYDEWVSIERERVQAVFEARMAQLLDQLINAERWLAVEEWAERWLALGGTREPAYRALMLASGARGDIAKVAALYRRCTEELLEQLGVEPSPETRALYDGLLKGARAPRATAQPSGTVTFLFTDIEGSTRLLEKLRDQYAVLLSEHHEILRAALRKWNGHEVDTQGDAFFVTFTRAIDAVQCAAEAQRAIAAHPWQPGAQLRVRMGLHTGEPLIASTGYVGMDVHRAARIGDAGHGGQVLLSQTTRDLVIQDLPQRLSIRDLGDHRLKDMKYPAPIYQLVIDGLPAEFPPVKTRFTGTEAPIPGAAPFKGLQYFEEDDTELFFGRELLTAKLVNRLKDARFLSVIIGASGSGKSSLVRAGLIPALKKGNELLGGTKLPKGSAKWKVHIITPTVRPLEALATELTRDSESVTATVTLLDDLMADPRSLSLFLARQYPKGHILLVIDQFEELFTLCRDEFEREAFIDNLLNAIAPEDSHITLIMTLRADFYAHLSQYPELREVVARQQEYIGPMTIEELRRAIEEPARRGHWEFEPGLVDLILRDVGDEPGALPLLSHALLETWKRRAGHMLTLKGYADAGGVRGAIAHTAESVYQNLTEDEQVIARKIFLRLTELGEGTEDTRRRASFHELMSQEGDANSIRTVLSMLADARLVTLSEETAEVAHEALIREWPTLREWLNQDRQGLQLHRRLTEAARDWELLGRDEGALYRGAALAQAREWAALDPDGLNTGEKTFLDASLASEQRVLAEKEDARQREIDLQLQSAEEQLQAAIRLRTRNRLITVVAVIAFVLALLAGVFGLQSNQNARQAETNLGIANQQRVAAQSAQATAIVESQVRATQQAVAEANFRQAEAQRLAAEASNLIAAQRSPELIALLSLRSLNTQYTMQGDAALTAAARLDYPTQLFVSSLSPIYAVAVSPDSKYVLTGETATATLWNVLTGERIRTFPRDLWVGNPILSVAYSPDGKYVLTGSGEGTARMLDATTGEQIHQFFGHRGAIFSMTFSPDGNTLLTGNLDGIARLWDTVTGKELHRFFSQANPVVSVAFSPDGKIVLLGHGDGTAGIWDVQTGVEIRQFLGHTASINAVAFSPDGKFILTAGADRTVRLWDAATGKELQKYIGHADNIWSVAFSPDGKYVFTSSNDGTVRKWDPHSGQELQRYTDTQEVTRMAVSPDGKVLVTGNERGEARLWRIKPAPKLPSLKSTGIINGVAFSPNGEYVLTGDSNGVVRLWDARTGEKIRDFIGHSGFIEDGVAFSPDGKYVLTGSWDHTVRLWSSESGQELRQFIGPTERITSVAFSPDGKYVCAGGEDGVWLWETETGKKVRQLTTFPDQVTRVAFSPDGNSVATVEGDDEIDENSRARLWDVSTGKLRFSTPSYSALNSIAFSPDGKHILTTGGDNAARLWDIQMNKEILQFSGHTASIWTAVFSPDGRYVTTASEDGTVRLWDARTGQELRRFIGHDAAVENVTFSPDGKYLVTGSDDGTAMLWDVDYRTTVQYLCSVLLRDFTEEERAQYNITDNSPTCPR